MSIQTREQDLARECWGLRAALDVARAEARQLREDCDLKDARLLELAGRLAAAHDVIAARAVRVKLYDPADLLEGVEWI